MCESRGQFGSTDKPRVVPWAQSVIPKWTGFSRIAAAALLPRRLLGAAIADQRLPPPSNAAFFCGLAAPGRLAALSLDNCVGSGAACCGS